MDTEWLSLPQAIESACEAGLARSIAVPRVIGLAKDQEVRSRIALEVNRHEGQPTPNVEMAEAHWRDLERFDSDWIDTGNAEWRDGYAWRGIEIHAGDLAIALGTKIKRFPANLQPVAPPVHGSERQLDRLDGIAVPDAIRLNDAVVDLSDGIREGPELSNAEIEIALRFYSTDSDTMREFQVREISMYYVREAIQSGQLVLYTMLKSGPYAIDRHALRELTFKTLRSGTYQPTNRLGDRLMDTALWILKADWAAFRQEVLASRFGGCSSQAGNKTSTASAENKCQKWLQDEFVADPDGKRTKSDFLVRALAEFDGRLSRRGFIRAWDAVAPAAGRSKPGRKS